MAMQSIVTHAVTTIKRGTKSVSHSFDLFFDKFSDLIQRDVPILVFDDFTEMCDKLTSVYEAVYDLDPEFCEARKIDDLKKGFEDVEYIVQEIVAAVIGKLNWLRAQPHPEENIEDLFAVEFIHYHMEVALGKIEFIETYMILILNLYERYCGLPY